MKSQSGEKAPQIWEEQGIVEHGWRIGFGQAVLGSGSPEMNQTWSLPPQTPPNLEGEAELWRDGHHPVWPVVS